MQNVRELSQTDDAKNNGKPAEENEVYEPKTSEKCTTQDTHFCKSYVVREVW
jgi:hypothetical protein